MNIRMTVATLQLLTPTGTDDHPLTGDRVGDGAVIVDEGGVKGHSINVQGHRGELDTERQVMPLTVTHLLRQR